TFSVRTLSERIGSWFPERELFMRSQGQVRFITLTPRMQMGTVALVLAVLVGWGVSIGIMADSQYGAEAGRIALLEREAEVTSAESRFAAYRDDIDEVARDVAQRMEFLEEAAAMLPASAVAAEPVSDTVSGTVSDSND